jgi:hypothetical protein
MVIMAIVVIAFVLARWVLAAHSDATRFVLAERPFVDPSRAPHGLYVLTHNGYDGQFFYRLALNPSNLHEGAYGFHFDTIFRLQRIGYPVLVWLITGGRPSLVPYGLIFVNVLGLVILGWLGGILARDSGRHAIYGLLIAGFFGFLFSLARDLSEIVAVCLAVGGLVAVRRQRWLVAGVLFLYAGLTRETTLIFAVAVAVTRIVSIARRQGRPGRPDVAWVLPAAGFLTWQLIVSAVRGQMPLRADAGTNIGAPLVALVRGIEHYVHVADAVSAIALCELVVLAAVIALAAVSVRTTGAPVQERVAWLLALVLVLVVSERSQVWNSNDDFRAVGDLFVLSMIILLASPRRHLRVPPLASTGAWLVVAAHWIARI